MPNNLAKNKIANNIPFLLYISLYTFQPNYMYTVLIWTPFNHKQFSLSLSTWLIKVLHVHELFQ